MPKRPASPVDSLGSIAPSDSISNGPRTPKGPNIASSSKTISKRPQSIFLLDDDDVDVIVKPSFGYKRPNTRWPTNAHATNANADKPAVLAAGGGPTADKGSEGVKGRKAKKQKVKEEADEEADDEGSKGGQTGNGSKARSGQQVKHLIAEEIIRRGVAALDVGQLADQVSGSFAYALAFRGVGWEGWADGRLV